MGIEWILSNTHKCHTTIHTSICLLIILLETNTTQRFLLYLIKMVKFRGQATDGLD